MQTWTTIYAIRDTQYAIRASALYNCRESSTNRPFYAKQTQITKCPNLYKNLLYKGLSKFYPAGGAQKQTQFKPNQTQFQKSQNERKLIYNKGLHKKMSLSQSEKTNPISSKAQNERK